MLSRVTPELLHKLRVPARLHVLALPFKKSMWNTPICRTTVQTMSGVHIHRTRPMFVPDGQQYPQTIRRRAGMAAALWAVGGVDERFPHVASAGVVNQM